jgi:fucose permease
MTSSNQRTHARLLSVLCYGSMMSLSIGLNLLPVFLTTLQQLLGGPEGLSKEELGRLGALDFSGLVLGIVITGPLADRWGAKPFVLLSNAMIAGSLAALAFAPSYAAVGAALFILGFGAGVLDMVLSPIVSALNPTRRAAALNWLHSFYCVGAVATILAGSLALRFGVGWKGSCLLLIPLPALLFLTFLGQRLPPLAGDVRRMPLRTLIRDRWFGVALAAIFFGGAAEMGMVQWLPAYAETSLEYTAWTGAMALLVFSVAMALGRMVIGTLGAKMNPFQIMAWSCGSTVILFLAGSFLPLAPAALFACVLAGFTGSCLWPTLLAVTADRYPEGGASMFGALGAFGNAGGILMPWMVGWIADRTDLHIGLASSALTPAAMLFLVRWLRTRQTISASSRPERCARSQD